LVVGLGWAWWPAGNRYQPVRAWEGGTVLDAVPAANSSRLEVGSRAAAATIWPEDGGPLPTAERPALAMVLVPAADGGTADADGGSGAGDAVAAAPTWVFPFDRPPAPSEGDNQALAVNTEDGSVAYDVTFALVWAEEDTVLNRNEAYALASCRDCRTVAVAFRVVLVVGSVDVVVPQNLAAAVNYACIECVTYALATQLVVSLPGALSEDAARDLDAIWAELAEFGKNIEDVPLAELRARLTEFESRILAVVQTEGVPADRPEGGATDEDAADAEPTGSSAPDGTTGSSGTAGPAGEQTAERAGSTSGADDGTTSSGPTGTSAPASSSSEPAETTSSPTSSSPFG
ncbi:MAG: hypothetical protein M3P89_04725, partial [Actinomycetota bacterium]|nr:hypothetical protein [Actinomycetota bacterium]